MDLASNHQWCGWFEIPVSDMERAMSFYNQVFDKKHERFAMGPLDMCVYEHGLVGMALVKNEFYQPGPQGPMVYLNANPDLQTFLDRIEPAGGKIIQDKKMISPEHGFMAVFTDTEGNRLALHSDK